MTDPTDEALGPSPRPFADFLREQRGGLTHSELTDGMAELIEAVHETGRAGTITYKVKVSPAGKGKHVRTVTVADDVVIKAPQHQRDETLFFIDTESNSLTRRDPTQGELPLQEVPRPATQLKDAR